MHFKTTEGLQNKFAEQIQITSKIQIKYKYKHTNLNNREIQNIFMKTN